jgi:hypothetical protein
MRNKIHLAIAVLLVGILLFVTGARDYAQTGNGYALIWSTIDSGGGMFSTGGAYSLGGTIGQADAGKMSGNTYELSGGFWNMDEPLFQFHILFLPVISK